MNGIDLQNQINIVNNRIIKLWGNRYQNINNLLSPLLYGNIKKSELIFISLNPLFKPGNLLEIVYNNEEFRNISKDYIISINLFNNINDSNI